MRGHPRIFAVCTVEGCSNRHVAKGLCTTHYCRARYSDDFKREDYRKRRLTWPSCQPEISSVRNHHFWIFNQKNPNHKNYKGMPFFDGWNPDKGGSFIEGARWIIANIGKRPENHTLDVVHHELGFVPNNLRWATPKGQRRNQLIKRISLLEHENEQLRKELMELKKEYTKCEQCNTPNRGGDECRECGANLRVETKENTDEKAVLEVPAYA